MTKGRSGRTLSEPLLPRPAAPPGSADLHIERAADAVELAVGNSEHTSAASSARISLPSAAVRGEYIPDIVKRTATLFPTLCWTEEPANDGPSRVPRGNNIS